MGISHGEPLRREIRSKNHTRPGKNSATEVDWPRPGSLSPELPGAERLGKKAYSVDVIEYADAL